MQKKAFIRPVSKWARTKAYPAIAKQVEGLFARRAADAKHLSARKIIAKKPTKILTAKLKRPPLAPGKRAPTARHQISGENAQTAREAGRQFLHSPSKVMKEGWGRMGTGERALLAGSAAMEAPGIVKNKKDRGKHIGGLVGGTVVPWLTLRRLPMAAQMAAWEGMHAGSRKIGGLADKAKKARGA